MCKTITFVLVMGTLMAMGCAEEMVGAPCVSETDNRKFSTELLSSEASGAITWSIETGSVQCATNLCLTQTKKNPDASSDRVTECRNDPTPDNCGSIVKNGDVQEESVLLKFSFCSCRCEDGDGNRQSDNPDKYDYLCECPPSAQCVNVLDKIGGNSESGSGISEKLFGSYCVPKCIAEPCRDGSAAEDNSGEVCTPSTNSKEPWLWSCEKITKQTLYCFISLKLPFFSTPI